MSHVLDTSSISTLGHYYPSRFPSLWKKLDASVDHGVIQSVREVGLELERWNDKEHLAEWIERHPELFPVASQSELEFVSEIFRVQRFQDLVRKKQILAGSPVADPFLIASAKINGLTVVTEERDKLNAVCIPSVCRHFGVECINLEAFMTRSGWQF